MSMKSSNTTPETKSAKLHRLLARKSGADLATLQDATGWQPHSIRAALSRFRKAGYEIERNRPNTKSGAATYRIVAEPETA